MERVVLNGPIGWSPRMKSCRVISLFAISAISLSWFCFCIFAEGQEKEMAAALINS
jgi:hypothetical protein